MLWPFNPNPGLHQGVYAGFYINGVSACRNIGWLASHCKLITPFVGALLLSPSIMPKPGVVINWEKSNLKLKLLGSGFQNDDRHHTWESLPVLLIDYQIPGKSKVVPFTLNSANKTRTMIVGTYDLIGVFCASQKAQDAYSSLVIKGPLFLCSGWIRDASPLFRGMPRECQMVDGGG